MTLRHPALRQLHTERLLLQASHAGLAAALLDFQARNQAHLRPWDPPQPPDFLSLTTQAERLRAAAQAFDAGSAFRWWLSPRDDPDRLIGTVHLSQVARGPFCNAALGYALDASAQGQGLMHEALQAVRDEAFSPRIHLHRLQAACRPENARSAAVLRRLGFELEGLAREYLFIDGAWRDHQLWALRHPHFQTPSGW